MKPAFTSCMDDPDPAWNDAPRAAGERASDASWAAPLLDAVQGHEAPAALEVV